MAYYLGQDFTETDLNYILGSQIDSSLTGSNAASSNAYNFFLDPGYNMFMGNYGMGPTNVSYTNNQNTVCQLQYQTLGSYPTINFGNNTTACGTSSVFHPLLVGWAERNVIPDPHSFQIYSNQFFQAPLSLPPNTSDSAQDRYFQHLVGDPNCPTTGSITCTGSNQISFTHYKGCRICDQFLNNGQPTINYRYCQFGFNWKYPLLGSRVGYGLLSLLGYLAIIAADWGAACYPPWNTCQNGSWQWLSLMQSTYNQVYAPTPIINSDLKLQWGKTGTNTPWNFNTYSVSFNNGQSISAPCPQAVTSTYNASRFLRLGAGNSGSCTSGSLNWNNFSIIQATGSNPYSSLT